MQINSLSGTINVACLSCGATWQEPRNGNRSPFIVRPCSDCRSKRYAATAAQRTGPGRELLEMTWVDLCPTEFRLTTESGGQTDIEKLKQRQPRLNEITQFPFKQGRGLILYGPTGTCKTRVAYRILRRFHEQGKAVRAVRAVRLDRECRDAGGNFTLSDWFNGYAMADIVLIDDVGKGKWSEATEAQVFDLIDERTINHRPMIITSNWGEDEMVAGMTSNRGPALVRRLRDYCDGEVLR